MRLNAEFDQRVVLRPADRQWVESPDAGMQRQWLELVGNGEVGRASQLVRLAAGTRLAPRLLAGGEELLVLEGSCADEHGDYAAGTYVRSPPGSRSGLHSAAGGLLLLKHFQFADDDRSRVVVDTRSGLWEQGLVDGLRIMPLHSHGTEHVAMVNWEPGTTFRRHRQWGGEEILVLQGVFEDARGSYPRGTWLRLPDSEEHAPFSREGCLLYVKTGHLTREALRKWRAVNAA
jgi:anti-sigma factor ChrR (cupin superfamily)